MTLRIFSKLGAGKSYKTANKTNIIKNKSQQVTQIRNNLTGEEQDALEQWTVPHARSPLSCSLYQQVK